MFLLKLFVLLLYYLHSMSSSVIINKLYCVQEYIGFGGHLKNSSGALSAGQRTGVETVLKHSSVCKVF